jgi:hypothetical protein
MAMIVIEAMSSISVKPRLPLQCTRTASRL